MQNVCGDPSQYSSSDLATVDHIRNEAKKLYSLYIVQKVNFRLILKLFILKCINLNLLFNYIIARYSEWTWRWVSKIIGKKNSVWFSKWNMVWWSSKWIIQDTFEGI